MNLKPFGSSLMFSLKIVRQFWFIKVHTKWWDFLSAIFLLVSMMVLGVARACSEGLRLRGLRILSLNMLRGFRSIEPVVTGML